MQKGIVALALLATLAPPPGLAGRLRQRGDIRVRLEAHEDLFILGVRDATAFAGKQGHIGGAVNILMKEPGQRIGDLVDWQERAVVLVTRTDRQAAKAAALSMRNGFGDVHIARDGMTPWNAIG